MHVSVHKRKIHTLMVTNQLQKKKNPANFINLLEEKRVAKSPCQKNKSIL